MTYDKYIESTNTGNNIAIPKIVQEELILADIQATDNEYVFSVMDSKNETSLEDIALYEQIKKDFGSDKQILLNVMTCMTQEKITGYKVE